MGPKSCAATTATCYVNPLTQCCIHSVCFLFVVQTCRFRWWTSYTTRGLPSLRHHRLRQRRRRNDSDSAPAQTNWFREYHHRTGLSFDVAAQRRLYSLLVRYIWSFGLTRTFYKPSVAGRVYLFSPAYMYNLLQTRLCRLYTVCVAVLRYLFACVVHTVKFLTFCIYIG